MLRTGTIETVANSLEMAKILIEDDPSDKLRILAYFFSHALKPFYDCMWEGLDKEAGDIIYSLSKMLPQQLRSCILIYPGVDSDSLWHTLSDWEKEWEELYPEKSHSSGQLDIIKQFQLLNLFVALKFTGV